MKTLVDLWNEPIIRCNPKGVVCQFAVKGEKEWSKCALEKCVKYKRPSRRYESNAKRPR
jgi:hypothetical protein